MFDRLIREALMEQAGGVSIPADIWRRVERRLVIPYRPRRSILEKIGIDRRLEAAAITALLIALIGFALLRAIYGPGTSPTATNLSPATPTAQNGAAAVAGDLVIEEYAVAERSVDQPTHFEFNDRIAPAVFHKRTQWKERLAGRSVEAVNAALKPFGWTLEPNSNSAAQPSYNLLKGNELVFSRISEFGPVEVSADGKDFALGLSVPGRGSFLVRPDGPHYWDLGQHYYQRPRFAGSDLAMVRMVGQDLSQYEVLRGDKVVYSGTMGFSGVELPLRGLHVWNGQWVLELDYQVLLEGASLNQALGFDQIFGFRMLDGRPFFFFQDEGVYSIWFDGKPVAVTYDEIVHYKCCEPAAFNPGGSDVMVTFYARRGEMWHYVEAGVYTP